VRLKDRGSGDAARMIASSRRGGMFSLFDRELSSSARVRRRLDFGVSSGVGKKSLVSDDAVDEASSETTRFDRLPRMVGGVPRASVAITRNDR
jgi:hypothetical protein